MIVINCHFNVVNGNIIVLIIEQFVVIILELVDIKSRLLAEGVGVVARPKSRGRRVSRQYPDVAARSESLLEKVLSVVH